jgi:hypothetical protein
MVTATNILNAAIQAEAAVVGQATPATWPDRSTKTSRITGFLANIFNVSILPNTCIMSAYQSSAKLLRIRKQTPLCTAVVRPRPSSMTEASRGIFAACFIATPQLASSMAGRSRLHVAFEL